MRVLLTFVAREPHTAQTTARLSRCLWTMVRPGPLAAGLPLVNKGSLWSTGLDTPLVWADRRVSERERERERERLVLVKHDTALLSLNMRRISTEGLQRELFAFFGGLTS